MVGADSSTELSEAGEQFLVDLFHDFQPDALERMDANHLTRLCPIHPFVGRDDTLATLEEFLNAWRLMAFERPALYLEAMA